MKPPKLLRATLIAMPFIMISLMIVVFGASSRIFGTQTGWYIGMSVYAIVFGLLMPRCILGSWRRYALLLGKPKKMDSKKKRSMLMLAFLPVFLVFISSFSMFRHADIAAVAHRIPIVLLVVFAHEVIWRGLYMYGFRGNINMTVFFPALMWGIWTAAPSVIFEYGGFFVYTFVKYFFLGLIWGYYAHKAKSIRISLLAHMIWALMSMMGLTFFF